MQYLCLSAKLARECRTAFQNWREIADWWGCNQATANGGSEVMKARDLVEYIQKRKLDDWKLKIEIDGKTVPIDDATQDDGFIKLYIKEYDEHGQAVKLE